ncbi:energy transducer TonB [Hymenobacter cavernae]|uniref:Collagen-binding protein n=1 Tax=Hymenobacter cavernae TaxID=2044852 RepID=A0ABQ1TTP1_9BACT|nr:energy transducer TonB [Hymenobacter cavernae]GGF03123.1 collagen-binding protein [Hymenobacter cavernae]
MRPANPSPSSSLPTSSGGHLPLALLRQYVAGTLTPASQHAVEAHTLGCPYCAEVLEGLSMTDLATTDKALSQLQQRLRTRIEEEEPRQAPIAWQRLSTIAAAVLLFVLVGAVGWLGQQKFKTRHSTREVATVTVRPSTQPADAPLAAPAAAAPSIPQAAPADIAMAPRSASKPRSALLAKSARPSTAETATLMKASELQSVADSISTEPRDMVAQASVARSASTPDSVLAPIAQEAKTKHEEVAVAAAPQNAAAVRFRRAAPAARPNTRLITGRIIDQQSGQALPGATILVRGTNIGTSTGPDGRFSLAVPKNIDALTVSSIGYETQQKNLANDTTLTLALAANTKALSEVVMVESGSKRKGQMPAPPPVAPMPVGGFPAFEEYLKKELHYPEEAESKHLEGTVKLEFTVTVEGKIENLKVVSGLSKECDAEALRLVQEGPSWRPAIIKGRPAAQKVRVNVPFMVK